MYKVYAITDTGKKRTQNQDGFLVDGIHCEHSDHREIYYESDGEAVHVALCDGVGSTEYAAYAVEKAQEYLCSHLKIAEEQEIESRILAMNEYVYHSLQSSQRADGACTIAGVVMLQQTAYIYNIGDSSVFSINHGYLEKQTTDDTLASLFGEQGWPEGEPSGKPPLLQSVGTHPVIELVHIKKEQNAAAFLLCTDGITDMLSLDEMEELLEAEKDWKTAAQRLVSEANQRGGYDNATVILLVYEEE